MLKLRYGRFSRGYCSVHCVSAGGPVEPAITDLRDRAMTDLGHGAVTDLAHQAVTDVERRGMTGLGARHDVLHSFMTGCGVLKFNERG
jgi:hypothetical protein